MKKKVTMQDIADKLNLSKNAVSQALTGKPGVSESTRKLVLQTAKELGYHYTAKKSKQRNPAPTCNIGLIASDFAFSHQFFGEIYLSIEREALRRRMNIMIQSINQKTDQNLLLPSFIENGLVEGILILSHLSTDYINKVIAKGIPTVLIDHHHPFIHADSILTNNRFAAYTAVQHLIDCNHKKIGFMGNTRFSPSYQERLEGYILALTENGIPLDRDFILTDAREEEEFIYSQLEQMKNQPTAWFCVNDGLGFLASTCLQKMGKKIPEEISICSFDNGPLSQMATPKITTVDIDLELFGRKAVEQLCWRMENRHEPFMEILLPAKLIPRESTASTLSENEFKGRDR